MFLLRWVRRVGIFKVGLAVGLAIAPLSANEQQQAQLNNREATTVALDNAGGYLSPRQIRTRARNAEAKRSGACLARRIDPQRCIEFEDDPEPLALRREAIALTKLSQNGR